MRWRYSFAAIVSAVARAPGQEASLPLRARFRRIPAGRTIVHGTAWSDQYPAGGTLALIDGLRGGQRVTEHRRRPVHHRAEVLLVARKGRDHRAEVGRFAEGLHQALEAKEGLALINGTQLMTSLGLHAIERAGRLVANALVATALTVEALEGSQKPFGAEYHALRPHPGIMDAARVLDQLLRDSEVMAAHRDCGRVQDPYSVRCAPQVIGASLDQIRQAATVLLREAVSVTDNPVLMPESGEVVTGGHFHGQPLALPPRELVRVVVEAAGGVGMSRCAIKNWIA